MALGFGQIVIRIRPNTKLDSAKYRIGFGQIPNRIRFGFGSVRFGSPEIGFGFGSVRLNMDSVVHYRPLY